MSPFEVPPLGLNYEMSMVFNPGVIEDYSRITKLYITIVNSIHTQMQITSVSVLAIFENNHSFILFLSFAFFALLLQGFIGKLARHFFYTDLLKAETELKVPANVKVRGGWRTGFYRDQTGGRLLSARVKFVEHGIVLRDIFSHLQIVFSPNFGTTFVPWNRLVNKRHVSIGWYNQFFVGEGWAELDVDGYEFSIVIQEENITTLSFYASPDPPISKKQASTKPTKH